MDEEQAEREEARGGERPGDEEGRAGGEDEESLMPAAGGEEPPEPEEETAGGDEPAEPEDAERPGDEVRPEREEPGTGTDETSTERARRPRETGPDQAPPDIDDLAGDRDAVERFDQLGDQPWAGAEGDMSQAPALGGELMLGPGMAIMEQRLQQVEGDPSMLMRNQFMLEDMRELRETGGSLQESRPW
jgi:Ca-activated chloride channel family protein